MGIGDVFAKAFELWRRDVGWLILAGLVVGLIMVVIFGVALGIFGAIFAGAGVTIGANLASDDSGALGALGAGMILLAIVVYVIVVFLVQVVAMVFYGGMFEMVIGAARGNRGVEFGDLFSGFRKFGAYVVYALVLFGISIGTSFLNIIPVIGWLAGLVISVWIGVIWLYVLPLIADQGVGFGDAAKRSFDMVKGVGWWRTFGMVVVLGLVVAAAAVVILLIAIGVGQGSDWAGILLGLVLFLVFAVLVPPYTICYVSVMYLGSGGAAAPVPAPGMPGAPLPPPPGAPIYGTPPSPPASAPVSGAATGVTTPVAPSPPSPGPDAWKAAADPLATGSPPAGPPATPAVAPQAHRPAVDSSSGGLEKHCAQCGALIEGSDDYCQACALEVSGGQTAATQAPSAGSPVPPAPEAPEAPEPPQPPEA